MNIVEFQRTMEEAKEKVNTYKDQIIIPFEYHIFNLPSLNFIYYIYKAVSFEENLITTKEKVYSLEELDMEGISDIAISIYKRHIKPVFPPKEAECFLLYHMDDIILHLFRVFYTTTTIETTEETEDITN